MSRVHTLLACIFAFPALLQAAPHIYPVPVPQELRSTAFTLTVNGKPVDVAHAAASYDFANFDITSAVDIEIPAADPIARSAFNLACKAPVSAQPVGGTPSTDSPATVVLPGPPSQSTSPQP